MSNDEEIILNEAKTHTSDGKKIWTQHCLVVMIEKFKEAIYRGNDFGALLTDLSKAFDCINHPFLIAKLYNYGVSPFVY